VIEGVVVAERALSPTRDMTKDPDVQDAPEDSRFGKGQRDLHGLRTHVGHVERIE
jgi:hypothetical protein